jgi:hypothetical protein
MIREAVAQQTSPSESGIPVCLTMVLHFRRLPVSD